MALNFLKILKGVFVQNEVDRTKEVGLTVDNSASSGTSTTIVAKQTLSRNLDLPNTSGELVEKDFAQVLTNKTIDGDVNTLQDISLPSLKTVLADANKFVARDVSGAVVSANAVPNGTVIGTTDTQTLTNKTIDADSNTITNIENADIKVGAAIDAAKLHDGSVSNTEFGYLNGVTSPIQTQIDAKAEISGATDNRLVKTDGATDIQQTGIAVDDSNNITGVNDLTVGGNLTVNGTVTTVNSATLNVTDQNITVNNGGTNLTAEGAGLTVDRVGTDGSLVYEDALSSKWKAGPLGLEVELANVSSTQSLTNKNLKSNTNLLTGARSDSFQRETGVGSVVSIPDVASADDFVTRTHPQVLTNKDYDGGVASNSRRITVPQDTLANLLALTRKEGTLLYANDTDKFYLDDGSTLKEVGSGAGEINFISNGDAEANTNGWVTYADAAGTRPVDGTGGSPAVTFTRTTTTPLSGQASFLFTKDAVNRQGQGASANFTIDLASRAKVLKVSFDYIVASGTFAAGSTTTDGDLIVYLYDVTNARLIEPSSFKLFSNSSTIADSYEANFQTSSDSSSYRLIFHCASTSAAAYSLEIDNVKVSPDSVLSSSRTVAMSARKNAGSHGTSGSSLVVSSWSAVDFDTHNAFNLTTGIYTVPVSGVYEISSRVTFAANATGSRTSRIRVNGSDVGESNIYTSFVDRPVMNASAQLQLNAGDAVDINAFQNSGGALNYDTTLSRSTFLQIQLVSGASPSADPRVIATRVNTSGTQSIPNATWSKVTSLATAQIDTNGAWDSANDRIFFRVSGIYRITASGVFLNNATGARAVSVTYNGAAIPSENGHGIPGTAVDTLGMSGTFLRDCVAGEFVELAAYQSSGAALNLIGGFLQVERLSGPSAIAANETIAVSAVNGSGQSIPNGVSTTVTNWTSVVDTHGAFNLTTGVFTAPAAGLYKVAASIIYNTGGVAALYRATISIPGGSTQNIVNGFTGSAFACPLVTAVSRLTAGQQISIVALQDSGAARTLNSSSTNNFIQIERIGL